MPLYNRMANWNLGRGRFLALFSLLGLSVQACDCGGVLKNWSADAVQNSWAVARVRVDSMASIDQTRCWVYFRGLELLWGDLPSPMKIGYDCQSSCAMVFLPGEEWLLYLDRQADKSLGLHFCSRSRKKPRGTEIDEGIVASRITYAEELGNIKATFPVRKFMAVAAWEKLEKGTVRSLHERRVMPYPDRKEAAVLLGISAAVFFLIWWILKRWLFR